MCAGKIISVLLFLCLLISSSRAAVNDTISGTVLDTLTSYPIDSVLVGTNGQQTMTKHDGTFQLVISATLAMRGNQMRTAPSVTWDSKTGSFSWPKYDGDINIRIHDLGGRMVAQYTLSGKSRKRRFSIARLPEGVFIAVFITRDQTVTTTFMTSSDCSFKSRQPVQEGEAKSFAATAQAGLYPLSFSRYGYIHKSINVSTTGSRTTMQAKLRDSILNAPWDWNGVVGTGQSLSVGARASASSITQPYHNLKMSTGSLPWPIDPDNSTLKMIPLVEPIGRMATSYPSSWPTNISKGETPHSAMGNQITSMFQAASGLDYISVQGCFGEDGQCMRYLKKNATQQGINGRAFAATVIETKAITRLARAAGKTYGIGAIIITHGECDADNTNYENDLYTLWSDYNSDLAAVTGQTMKIPMLVSQQNSINDHAASTTAEWKVGNDYPGDIICIGPKYQYQYYSDNVHLIAKGYQQLGEKYGQVYFHRVVLGQNWQPLAPIAVSRSGQVISVRFHVPVPPLVWNAEFQAPHQGIKEWKNGKGFEVRTASGTKVTINSVAIFSDSVLITCSSSIAAGVLVGYAQTSDAIPMSVPYAGTVRWGLLHDSDPFVGSVTKKAQPNWAVAFELAVP